METAQRRVAITKLSRIPGYADGGEVSQAKKDPHPFSLRGIYNNTKSLVNSLTAPETPEQGKARRAAEYEEMKAREGKRTAERQAQQPQSQLQQPNVSAGLDGAGGGSMDKRMKEAGAYAGGGAIRGKGTGTSDEIPAMLSNGEFVVRAAAVKEIGLPALRAINALGGALPKSPNRNDNKYAEGDIVKDRDALVAQIPTGGTGSGPTPQPDPSQSASGTELGRNVNNAISALAPLSGGTALVNGASRLGAALGTSATAGKIATGVAQAMPYATPAAGAIGLSMASSPSAAPVTPAQQQLAGAVPTNRPSETAPTTVAAPTLNGAEGKDVGFGATRRYDVQGKSPLFTNLAADDPSNVALMNRKPMTAQDQGAMDGIQARQDANDQGMRNKMQYDAEVAQAQAFNAGQKQFHMEQAALKGNKGAQAILAGNLQADTTRRGQDITAKGQDQQAGALRASQKLAQNKDGREATASAMDQKSRQQLMDAQQEFLNAKTPDEQKAAERKLTTLGGKQTNDKGQVISLPDTLGDQGQVIRGGQAVLMPDGSIVRPEQAGANPKGPAGVHAPTSKAEYDKLPKGAKYTHPDGTTRTKG